MPNDTKVVRQLHGIAPAPWQGFPDMAHSGRWWVGDDVFFLVLLRAFAMTQLAGWACELGQAGACCWSQQGNAPGLSALLPFF